MNEGDSILVCERVVFGDGTTSSTCEPAPTEAEVPPQQVLDAAHDAFVSVIDPVVCPLLAAHAGNYPGGVAITSTGDVRFDDPLSVVPNPVYDCPPYRPQLQPVLVVVGPVRT